MLSISQLEEIRHMTKAMGEWTTDELLMYLKRFARNNERVLGLSPYGYGYQQMQDAIEAEIRNRMEKW